MNDCYEDCYTRNSNQYPFIYKLKRKPSGILTNKLEKKKHYYSNHTTNMKVLPQYVMY